MKDRDIILPLLRLVIPGEHDPALDYYPATGPKGGRKVVCPHGAFNPKDGYLTRLIRNKNSGIRHGYRGFWQTTCELDEEDKPKRDAKGFRIFKTEFTMFSITLPDDPVVRIICNYPWKSAPNWKSEFDAMQSGNFRPMLDEIRTIALQEAIRKSNGHE